MLKDMTLAISTSAGGAATVNGERGILGKLYAVEYRPNDMDTGADLTLTCEGEASKPLLTQANAGTTNRWWYPRDLEHGVEDGAALTGTAGGDRTEPLLSGVPKLVVAQGGATKTGTLVIYYEE